MISHWLQFDYWWAMRIPWGTMGVDFFFVLSGFLITGILLREKENQIVSKKTNRFLLQQFYIRRTLRLFPLYYLTLLIVFLFNRHAIGNSIWWQVCYLSNFYVIKINEFPGIISHFWSLSVEEHFYILWAPIVLFVPVKFLKNIFISIIAASVLCKAAMLLAGENYYMLHVFSFNCFDALAVGGLLAFLKNENSVLLNIFLKRKIYVLVAVIIFGILIWANKSLESYNMIFSRLIFSIFSAWIIGNAAANNFKNIFLVKILENKFLVFTGTISYGLYLFHNFSPGFCMGLKYPTNELLRFLIYFGVTFIIATVAWFLVEKPIEKIKEKFY
jgi:peptidoglycan/LPS O-acetylase OafA/YrhL